MAEGAEGGGHRPPRSTFGKVWGGGIFSPEIAPKSPMGPKVRFWGPKVCASARRAPPGPKNLDFSYEFGHFGC